jgi:hypothetical protein
MKNVIILLFLIFVGACMSKTKEVENKPQKFKIQNPANNSTIYERVIINGKPIPPPGYEWERRAVELPKPNVDK